MANQARFVPVRFPETTVAVTLTDSQMSYLRREAKRIGTTPVVLAATWIAKNLDEIRQRKEG